MTTFDIMMKAESVDCDLEKISFMAGEIAERTCTEQAREEIELKDIELFACMIIDYAVKAQDTLKAIVNYNKTKRN